MGGGDEACTDAELAEKHQSGCHNIWCPADGGPQFSRPPLGPQTAYPVALAHAMQGALKPSMTGTLSRTMTRTMTQTFSRTLTRTSSRTMRGTMLHTIAHAVRNAVADAVGYPVADASADAVRDAVDDASSDTSPHASPGALCDPVAADVAGRSLPGIGAGSLGHCAAVVLRPVQSRLSTVRGARSRRPETGLTSARPPLSSE